MIRAVALCLLVAAPAAWAKKPKKDNGADRPSLEMARPEPTGPPMVELRCPYEAGATHQFRVVKTTDRTWPDRPSTTRTSSTVVDLSVVSTSPERSVFELRYGKSQFQGEADPLTTALAAKLSSMMVGTPVRLAVTHGETTLSVENRDELAALTKTAMSDLADTLLAKDPNTPPEVLEGVRSLGGDPAAAEAAVLQDFDPLFTFTCGTFPLDPSDYEVSLPNPLGGPPFPAKGTVTALRMDYSTIAFDVAEVLDPISADALLKPLTATMGEAGAGADVFSQLQLDVRKKLHVEVPIDQGWPVRISSERTTSAMGAGRVDRMDLTMLY